MSSAYECAASKISNGNCGIGMASQAGSGPAAPARNPGGHTGQRQYRRRPWLGDDGFDAEVGEVEAGGLARVGVTEKELVELGIDRLVAAKTGRDGGPAEGRAQIVHRLGGQDSDTLEEGDGDLHVGRGNLGERHLK